MTRRISAWMLLLGLMFLSPVLNGDYQAASFAAPGSTLEAEAAGVNGSSTCRTFCWPFPVDPNCLYLEMDPDGNYLYWDGVLVQLPK